MVEDSVDGSPKRGRAPKAAVVEPPPPEPVPYLEKVLATLLACIANTRANVRLAALQVLPLVMPKQGTAVSAAAKFPGVDRESILAVLHERLRDRDRRVSAAAMAALRSAGVE